MNQKSVLLILALVSFGLGAISDRLLFNPGDSSQVVIREQSARGSALQGNNEEISQRGNRSGSTEKSRDSREDEEQSRGQEHEDPVEQLVRDIENGQGIDAARVTSVTVSYTHLTLPTKA